jgi:hypothetical protein
MIKQNISDELLTYLVGLQNSGVKNWFNFNQQRITGIYLAYEIAKNHASSLSPEQAVDYAIRLNNAIYTKMIKAD